MSYEKDALIERGRDLGLELRWSDVTSQWYAYYKENLLFSTNAYSEMSAFISGWKEGILKNVKF